MNKPTSTDKTISKRKRRPAPEPQKPTWHTLPVWAAILLLGLAAAVAYLRVRTGGFVWDDQILLVEWPYYRDPALLAQALTSYLPFSANYFRPVVALTFFANYALHGLMASGYRLTNVLLHALTSVFAYLLLRRYLSALWDSREAERQPAADRQPAAAQPLSEWLAFGLSLLFAWHPVHVENIAFTVGRFDLLSTLFVLLALLLASWAPAGRWGQPLLAVGTGLAFLLALGSKEMAITFPLLLLALDRFRRVRWQRRWPFYLATLVAAAAYLALRAASLGYLYRPQPEAALPVGGLLQRFLLAGRSLAHYLLLLVWPFGTLAPIHFSPLPVPGGDLLAWGALVVVLLLLAVLAWGLWRRKRTAWLWLAFAISLLPVANILPLEMRGGAIVAERFLYLPSFLFLLAAGATLLPLLLKLRTRQEVTRRKGALTVVGAAGAALLVACLIAVLTIAPHWQDNQSLWEWAAAKAPDSSLPLANLSRVALNNGDWLLALEYANEARALNPDDATAHNNAGSAMLSIGEAGAAESAFQSAVDLQPESTLYWTNLAAARGSRGYLDEAVGIVQDEVLSRDPTFGPAHALLGTLYLNQGQPQEALSALEQAQRYLPDPSTIQSDLAEALFAAGQGERALELLQEGEPLSAAKWREIADRMATAGQPETALRAYEQALATNAAQGGLEPSDVTLVQIQRAAVYQTLGDLDNAEQAAVLAMMTDQSNPLVHKVMGDILYARGSLLGAQKAYERAQQMAPGFSEIYFDLGVVLWEQGKQEEARQKFGLYLEMAPSGAFAEEAQGYLAP